MAEVHTSSRPGRPATLIVMSGLVLAGTLGVAWFQTNEKRALAAPLRIGGTPLVVRPPRGWTQSPDDPGRFVLAERNDPSGTQGALDRRIEFSYERRRTFVPPEQVILSWDRLQRAQSEVPVRTSIRGIPAIQVIRHHQQRAFGITFEKESILRVAAHPRGDVIAVEYSTVMQLSSADLELMDSICAAVDFVDPELQRGGQDAQRRAGLEFPTPAEWSVLGPRHDESDALHVLSLDSGGETAAVAVARTWLTAGRSPADLLRDYLSINWPARSRRARVLEWGRRDGVTVHGIQLSDPGYPLSQSTAAYALSTERGDLALILPDAGGYPTGTLALAERLADVVTFSAGYAPADFSTAAREGEAIAAKIRENGAVSWWGRSPQRQEYLRNGRGAALAQTVYRQSAGRTGDAYSYRGTVLTLDTAGKRFERARWTLDERAAEYQLTLEMGREDPLLPGVHGLSGEWTIREALTDGPSRVRREVLRGGQIVSETTFDPGPAFIPPPVEEIAESLVAAGAAGTVLVQVSNVLGTGSNPRLLRRLEPDAAGRARVLRVDDYAPLGVVLTFDADHRAVDRVVEGLVVSQFDTSERPPRLLLRMRELLESER
jgi:hypothetical protein